MSEIWDCYDKQFVKVSGRFLVRDDPAGFSDNEYHLVCDIAVRHKDGTYLLMQRDHRKSIYPGKWELSAGGSALAGESPEECAARELFEETGLTADSLNEIGRSLANPNHCHYVLYSAEVSCAKYAVKLQDGETVAFRWLEKQAVHEIKEELASRRILGFLREFDLD